MKAPWRWHWLRILGFAAQCGAWYLALVWSPFFGIPLSLWVALNVRAGYTGPRSPTAPEKGFDSPTSGYVMRRSHNDAQTTFDPPVSLSHQVV